MRFLLLLLTIISCSKYDRNIASAQTGTFGSEFTFTNQALINRQRLFENSPINNGLNEMYRSRVLSTIQRRCADCRIRGNSWIKVTYPDGFWVSLGLDQAVVEINMLPSSPATIKKNLNRLQEDLFNTFREHRLWPHFDTGGGHIHLGVESNFGNDADLFRKFIKDYHNHPELALSIFRDSNTANPHFIELGDIQIRSLRRTLDTDLSIEQTVEMIHTYTYTAHPKGLRNKQKFNALNFQRIVDHNFSNSAKTLEIRAIRPQADAMEYYKIIKLFEARIEYLKHSDVKIDPNISGQIDYEDHLKSFIKYVDETGLRHQDYFDVLPIEFMPIIQKQSSIEEFASYLLAKAAKTSPSQWSELESSLKAIKNKFSSNSWQSLWDRTQRIKKRTLAPNPCGSELLRIISDNIF